MASNTDLVKEGSAGFSKWEAWPMAKTKGYKQSGVARSYCSDCGSPGRGKSCKVRRRMGSTGLAETEALATTKATVRSDEEVGSCVVRAL